MGFYFDALSTPDFEKKKLFYGFLKVRSKAQVIGKMEGGSCSVTASAMDVDFFGHNLPW